MENQLLILSTKRKYSIKAIKGWSEYDYDINKCDDDTNKIISLNYL